MKKIKKVLKNLHFSPTFMTPDCSEIFKKNHILEIFVSLHFLISSQRDRSQRAQLIFLLLQ